MDLLVREPFEVYQAKKREYLTSHQLADFRKCPQLYHQKKLGLIDDEDRPAYLIGRAAHTFILEGRERFEKEFIVGGPINPRTGSPFGPTTKAWSEWAEAQNRHVLTDSQFELISRLDASVHAHPIAGALLRHGVAEGVARADYCGMPCQIRIDWFHPERGIVDLKTCDDLTWFEADARRFGYVHQLAFYRAVLAQLTHHVSPVHFIAVEKKAPFRCGVWQVQPDAIDVAQADNEAAIARLQRCQVAGVWETGYETVRFFDGV